MKPVYIKRFGRPLLIQALMVTIMAPFLPLVFPLSSQTWNIVAVVGVIVPFWLAWAFWGRSSVEIDAESFTVKKSGTRIYRWSDAPKFIYHRHTLMNRRAYLEVIRQDHVSDFLDDLIADDQLLNEIRKYASIEITDEMLPRGRYG